MSGDPSPYTTATYDANGNALTQTDASGNTTAFEYDHLGRLKTATQPETDQHDAPVTTYVYDAAGDLAEVHAPGPDGERVTKHEYNFLGQEFATPVLLAGESLGEFL